MIVPSIFGDLASRQNMQAMIDNSIDFLQTQSVWRQYLDWGLPQLQLTFETAIGRTRIEAAAAIVDIDAPAPVRSRHKLELLSGKIPTMKQAFYMDQADYRAMLQLQNLPISDAQRKAELIRILFNDIQTAVTAPDRRIDIMFYQGVSSFKVDCTVLGNPEGVAFGEIDLLADASQSRPVSVVWSDPTADPFKDISDMVIYAAAKGLRFGKIWIDQEKWLEMKNLDAVKSAISGYLNPGSNRNFVVTEAMINEYLVANRLPRIEIINVRSGIESDGVITTFNPFKKENVVFLPDGKLGTVHNALAIEDMQPVDGVEYAKFDRTLLAKWRDNNPWRETTQVELNAFPALERIENIYHLNTDVAA